MACNILANWHALIMSILVIKLYLNCLNPHSPIWTCFSGLISGFGRLAFVSVTGIDIGFVNCFEDELFMFELRLLFLTLFGFKLLLIVVVLEDSELLPLVPIPFAAICCNFSSSFGGTLICALESRPNAAGGRLLWSSASSSVELPSVVLAWEFAALDKSAVGEGLLS